MAICNRICKMCGKDFLGGSHAFYCTGCRRIRDIERNRDYRQRLKNNDVRHTGEICICENCGMEYELVKGIQKYCPDCRDEMNKQTARRLSSEYARKKYSIPENRELRRKLYREEYAKNPEKYREIRRLKYKKYKI